VLCGATSRAASRCAAVLLMVCCLPEVGRCRLKPLPLKHWKASKPLKQLTADQPLVLLRDARCRLCPGGHHCSVVRPDSRKHDPWHGSTLWLLPEGCSFWGLDRQGDQGATAPSDVPWQRGGEGERGNQLSGGQDDRPAHSPCVRHPPHAPWWCKE
jgi:hypothetical protein